MACDVLQETKIWRKEKSDIKTLYYWARRQENCQRETVENNAAIV